MRANEAGSVEQRVGSVEQRGWECGAGRLVEQGGWECGAERRGMWRRVSREGFSTITLHDRLINQILLVVRLLIGTFPCTKSSNGKSRKIL